MAMNPFAFHMTFLACFCVFFIVGLPMWLVGCNPDVPNGCITRSIEDANVTSVDVQSGVCCSSCKCGKSTCCCGGYSCYSVSLGLDTNSGHCTGSLNGVYHSSSDATATGRAVGPTTRAVIDPRTKLCSVYLKDYYNIWVAGVFFLFLTACCTFIWCGYAGTSLCCKDKLPAALTSIEMNSSEGRPPTQNLPGYADPYSPALYTGDNITGASNPYTVGTQQPQMFNSNITTYATPIGENPQQPQFVASPVGNLPYNSNPYPQQQPQPQQMTGYNNPPPQMGYPYHPTQPTPGGMPTNPQMVGYAYQPAPGMYNNNNPQMGGYIPYQSATPTSYPTTPTSYPTTPTPGPGSGQMDDAPPAYDDAPPSYEGEQRSS